MKSVAYIIILTSTYLLSCGKSKPQQNDYAPTNLTLSISISTDNSGLIECMAKATNAVSYEFDFGNGIYQTSSTGSTTYKYPASGSYTVAVTAKSPTGLTSKTTKDILISRSTTLVWSDEFDVAGSPSSSKWGYDLGTGSGGWGNNELEYYTDRAINASVANGVLKITAIKENFNGSAYTSARLLSKGKYSFKYGKMEVRAKLPIGSGTWPAAWMLGNNITTASWPACGEIDVMEHKGNDVNKIYGTLHYPGRSGGNADGSTKIITNATSDFHVYSVEWTSSLIQIAVDGVVFHSYTNTSSSPFNQEFFIILNVAMGGTFGGSIDPAFSSASMEVDYVRVYQ